MEYGLDVSFKLGPAILMIGMLVLFIVVGLTQKTQEVDSYWVAGRGIGPVENGMAVAGNWMSAASFLGMAGSVAILGFFGLAYVVGWTTGYFILLIFMASQIRKYGKYTAPDFIGDRYYSNTARAIAACSTVIIGVIYAVAQYGGISLMFGYILGVDYTTGVWLGTVSVVIYVVIAGMLGVTRNQAVQYAILIVAFLLPIFTLTSRLGYFFIPQIGYGAAVSDITNQIAVEFSAPWANASFYQWIALCFTMIVGTCGLPHVLTRFYTVPHARTARWSVVWGLFFICILYWTAPAYSAFGTLIGHEVTGTFPVAKEISDAIVVVAAQYTNMPQIIVGFLAAGAVAAAFSTSSGVIMAGSSAVAHDIYKEILKPDATGKEELMVARLTIVVMGFVVTFFALQRLAMIAALVGMAFSVAGITIFPVFFAGLWWERATKEGAIAAMSFGLIFSLTAIFMGTVSPFWATYITGFSAAIIGTPVAFLIIYVVSKMTPPPPMEVRRMVRQVHSPTSFVTRKAKA